MDDKKWSKPDQVTSLQHVSKQTFALLKEQFHIGDHYTLPLSDVDSAAADLQVTTDVAAIAMRKVQALRFVSRPGVPTTNDVIVSLCGDLARALTELSAHLESHVATTLIELRNSIMEAGRAAASINGNDIVELE